MTLPPNLATLDLAALEALRDDIRERKSKAPQGHRKHLARQISQIEALIDQRLGQAHLPLFD